MRFVYPQRGTNYDASDRATRFGNYPLSSFNCWHGGIHLDEQRAPLQAVADGRIIAYRLPSTYHVSDHATPQAYSDGFVLVQHDYESPRGQGLRFYALYHHVASHQDIAQAAPPIPAPAFIAKRVTRSAVREYPKGVRARSATEMAGLRGKEIVLLPKNTRLTRNPCGAGLADWAVTWNETHPEHKKYYAYTYTDPFTNTVYADLHVFTGALKLVDPATRQYRVTWEKETPLRRAGDTKSSVYPDMVPGLPVYDKIRGSCVGVIAAEEELHPEKSAHHDWLFLPDRGVYVKKAQTAVRHIFRDDLDTDTVVASDIPVRAGDLIGYVGKYGHLKDEQRYSTHFELFSDTGDAELCEFLEDTRSDGTASHQRYEIAAGTRLSARIPCDLTLPRGTPVKILRKKGDEAQVQVTGMEAELRRTTHIIEVLDENGRDIFLIAPDGRRRAHYTLDPDELDYSNSAFNGLLTADSIVYFKEKLGTGKSRSFRRLVLFFPEQYGKTFWLPQSAVATTDRHGTHLAVEVSDSFLTPPTEVCDEDNVFRKTVPLRVRPSIRKDHAGRPWYRIVATYLHDKQPLRHIGYLRTTDAGVTARNPFDWTAFGYATYDAGSDYVYALKDYHRHTATAPFVDHCWRLIDTDGDGTLTPLELQRAQSHPRTSSILDRLVVKHRSEWSYTPAEIARAAREFYALGIEAEEDDDRKRALESERDRQLELLEDRVKRLMWWDSVQQTPYVPGPDSPEKEFERRRAELYERYGRQSDADYAASGRELEKQSSLVELETRYRRYGYAREPDARIPLLAGLGQSVMYDIERRAIESTYARMPDAAFAATPEGRRMEAELDALERRYRQGRHAGPPRQVPTTRNVWHFSGIGFVRQLRLMYPDRERVNCCTAPVTPRQLRRLFPRATEEKLHAVADAFNEGAGYFGLNDCGQRAHFFAQVREESGANLYPNEGESMNFSAEDLPKHYRVFRADPSLDENSPPNALAYKYGRSAQNNYVADREMIANYAMAGRNGNRDEVSLGDGWTYRGRGYIQVTGRAKYLQINNALRRDYPAFGITIDHENINNDREGMIASLAYWKEYGVLKAAAGGLDRVAFDKVVNIINRKTDSREKRWGHLQKAMQVFNTSSCGLPDGEPCPTCGRDHPTVDLAEPAHWITQEPGLCWHASHAILRNYGLSSNAGLHTNCIIMASQATQPEIEPVDFLAGLNYLNAELREGRPVMVGVDDSRDKKYNHDHTTEHFIVIVGSGCSDGTVYYRFFDPFTGNQHLGTRSTNRLYADFTTQFVQGNRPDNNQHKKYTVAQVRRN